MTRSKQTTEPKGAYKSRAFHLEFLNAAQKMAWAAFEQHDVLFLLGPAGTGKAQPLDSLVYTPTGPRKMGDIRLGDVVCTPQGQARVSCVFPQGEKDIYRVIFHDGSSTECCLEHLWKVSSNTRGWSDKVVDTRFLLENCRTPSGRRHLYIETTTVDFLRKKFLINPYLLGVLIAEGNLTNTNVCFSTSDDEIIQRVSLCLGSDYCVKTKCGIDHRIVRRKKNSSVNRYKEELKRLGLWQCYSYEKHIPEEYINSAVDQRLLLLQALLDCDGTVDKRTSSVSYSTTSDRLASDFIKLVNSLGGIVKTRIKETPFYYKDGVKVFGRKCYQLTICCPNEIQLFLLPRKLRLTKARCKYKPKRILDRVEFVERKQAQCIMLDGSCHLYLTDNFIVTHNTHLAVAFAISELIAKEKKRIILTRPIVESGESLGFLPGTFDEKVNPYMLPLYDCIGKLVGYEGPQREKIDRALEVAPLAYMRGRSISNSEDIPTPKGLVKMGEIQEGDYVFGSDGQPKKVMKVYPQGKLPVFEITFSDHTKSICSADHLWNTMTLNEKRHNKGYTVKSTAQIMECVKDKYNRKFHRVPILSAPVAFMDNPIPIHPYLLGVLLGDGHFGKSLSIASTDTEIIDECLKHLPPNHSVVYKGKYDYRIQSNGKCNKIKQSLIELGLWGKKFPIKHIPDVYKFNSVECRLAVLRGLMDTNGWICNYRSGICRVQFCSASKQLADDLMWLVRSLGGFAYGHKREFDEFNAHIYNGKVIRHVHAAWVVDISLPMNPFVLSRKASKYKQNQRPVKMISSIKPAGESECTCIKVDAADSLFLTNNCIVTHNTFDNAVCIFDEAQNASLMQLKLFLTRFGENSKIIVTGDPLQSDLRGPVALVDVVERLKEAQGIGVIEFNNSSIVRHPLVGRILERLA